MMGKSSGTESGHRVVDPSQIPDSTVIRLSRYLRTLERYEGGEKTLISSSEIARDTCCNPAQVRKDLSYFGEFGNRGKGYDITFLRKAIQTILGLNSETGVAIVGIGNLGSAFLNYRGFAMRGFFIRAAFDESKAMVGKTIGGTVVRHVSDMPGVLKELGIQIVVLTVPSAAAQQVADVLVACGIKAILNMAPSPIVVPPTVVVRHADVTTELEALSFHLAHDSCV